MEYAFSIAALVTGLWGVTFFALDSYNRKKRVQGLFKVSKKVEDADLRGKIVKIVSLDGDEAYVKTIEPVTVREKYYPNMEMARRMSAYGYTDPSQLQQVNRYEWVTRDTYPEGEVNVKYLKRVKQLNLKGGEKKVNKMPRLWKWLIIYLPATILVWDVVNHANQIALWFVNIFPHR